MDSVDTVLYWSKVVGVWLCLGLLGELCLVVSDILTARRGHKDFWLRDEHWFNRFLFPVLLGAFAFFVGFISILGDLRSLHILFKKPPQSGGAHKSKKSR